MFNFNIVNNNTTSNQYAQTKSNHLINDFRNAFNASQQLSMHKCHNGFLCLKDKIKQVNEILTLDLLISEKAAFLRIVNPQRPLETETFNSEWNDLELKAQERINTLELKNQIQELEELKRTKRNFVPNLIKILKELKETIDRIGLTDYPLDADQVEGVKMATKEKRKRLPYQQILLGIKQKFEELAGQQYAGYLTPTELNTVKDYYDYLQPILYLPNGDMKMDTSDDENMARDLTYDDMEIESSNQQIVINQDVSQRKLTNLSSITMSNHSEQSSINNPLILPEDVIKKIFEYFQINNIEDLPSIALVCQDWRNKIDCPEFRAAIRPNGTFGSNEWIQYTSMNPGIEPKLPRRAYADMKTGKFLLTLIPETLKFNAKWTKNEITEKIDSVQKLSVLMSTSRYDGDIYFDDSHLSIFGSEKSHWALVNKTPDQYESDVGSRRDKRDSFRRDIAISILANFKKEKKVPFDKIGFVRIEGSYKIVDSIYFSISKIVNNKDRLAISGEGEALEPHQNPQVFRKFDDNTSNT